MCACVCICVFEYVYFSFPPLTHFLTRMRIRRKIRLASETIVREYVCVCVWVRVCVPACVFVCASVGVGVCAFV